MIVVNQSQAKEESRPFAQNDCRPRYGGPDTESTAAIDQATSSSFRYSRIAGILLLFNSVLVLAVFVQLQTILHRTKNVKGASSVPRDAVFAAQLSPLAFQTAPVSRQESSTRISKSSGKTFTVLILYLEGHGHQQKMARSIADGVMMAEGSTIPLLETYEAASFENHILHADAIILGSPVYNSNVHPKVQEFVNTWEISKAPGMRFKVGAAFVTAGGISAGQEGTMVNLLQALMTFQMIVVGGGSWETAYGASAIVGEEPFAPVENKDANPLWFPKTCYPPSSNDVAFIHPMFLAQAQDLGRRVGLVVDRLTIQ